MPFDPYALCPGGRDKKIRFCCPNMTKEIEQVGRLLESGQTGACLSYIESLEKTHTNCACLTTAKLAVYRAENRWQEALPIAEQFHNQEPDNPTAAAEYALALVVTGNPTLAVSTLVDAFERANSDSIHSTLLHAALQIATYLLLGKAIVPAIAIGHVLKEIPAIAEPANILLYKATSETNTPLILRDWGFDFNCPDNFPNKEAFEEVAVLVRLMRWKQALVQLESLTQYADAWSGIWRNIAAIRLWLLDVDEGREALKKYASLSNTPLEDAVDAETVRLLFSADPLGDHTNLIAVEYTIADADKALEKLLSHALFDHVEIPDGSDSPPPKGCFTLMSRPFHEPGTAWVLDNVPMQQGLVILYGKETDRESRLFVQIISPDGQEVIETQLRNALDDLIQMPGNITNQRPVSKTRLLGQFRFCFAPGNEPDADTVQKLINDYYLARFPETWIALPLGLLDGKTPGEAAKEPKYMISLSAAIQMVELWMDYAENIDVASALRSRLGLPALDTITVTETSGENPLTVLNAYPVWRWYRFDVTKLSTEVLAGGLPIVSGMHENRAAALFAEELLNRPMDSMEFPVRIMAFESLITAAQASGDIEKALLWVERAKGESAAQNIADAAWCLHEIALRFMQGNGEAMNKTVQYLMTHYKNDNTVMESLFRLFVQLGILGPNGAFSDEFLQIQAEQKAEEQKIWTPDGGTPPGSAAASKLWVPD